MYKHLRLDAHTPQTGALDFSFLLDAPAGKHGQTVIKDGRLFFEDGTRARFVGFNFHAPAMMPKKASAVAYAERLASLGCNVVRLVAGDTKNKYGLSLIDYSDKGKGRELNPEMLDRVHFFVSELKKRGIYVQVDLHVFRTFTNTGDLKITPPDTRMKGVSVFDQELIDLQKDYATKYLSARNPYTGFSFLDDPAVMCIQITNENSVFFESLGELANPGREPYEKERKQMFNDFLLKKYGSREMLEKAWTRNGECALMFNEDPAEGTVEPIEYGDYIQPYRDPRSYWCGPESPARYADYLEFGMEVNRHYYTEICTHIKKLGAKAPVNGCNLLHGIADIYSSTSDIDLPENNSYYNHPMGGNAKGEGVIFTWHENVKTDPRKTTYPVFNIRDNNMIQQTAGGAVKGKPYIINEWNEYGGMPFHSTAYLMEAAYASLQGWDGLMIYNYTHSDDHEMITDDFIGTVYDGFNDPSLIGQFGAMAFMFLRGCVKEAENSIDVCYTDEDLKMLPENYKLPFGFLPFVSKIRTVFIGDKYSSDADVALSSGFSSSGDYTEAKHSIVYARSPYRDALQHDYIGTDFLDRHRGKNPAALINLGTISDASAVIDMDKIDGMERNADHTAFSRFSDAAMKKWGLLKEGRGLAEINCFVSDTGEIRFDFGRGMFTVDTPEMCVFSGYPEKKRINLGNLAFEFSNEKLTAALIPIDGNKIIESKRLVATFTAKTGNDANKWAGDISLGFAGKIQSEQPEGRVICPCANYEVYALDIHGNRLSKLSNEENSYIIDTEGLDAVFGFEIVAP